jgi:hypothetical protein
VEELTGLSRDDFANWLTPQQAFQRVREILGHDPDKAIWERLIGGIIRTVALKSSRASPPNAEPQITDGPGGIPARYWGHFSGLTQSDFWQTADARFYFPAERKRVSHPTVIRCFDVRLHPADVETSFPPLRGTSPAVASPVQETPPPDAEPATAANRGGRPRKDWWDDFWIDICGQIYEGTLRPARQADLERAMLDWVSDHGHDVGETTIKSAARKLFRAWKLEVKN